MLSNRTKLIAVGGPTCTGKSALAIDIAHRFGGEIINGDSMQVYRYFDIGTAKPSPSVLKDIPHHLVGVVNPDDEFNASLFKDLADHAITNIAARGKVPIIVGGTGLYLRVLFYGLFPAYKDESLRERLNGDYARDPVSFYERLKAIDAAYALRISYRDRIRMVRAMEIYLLGGKRVSDLEKEHGFRQARYDVCKIGLTGNRGDLYRRIDERVLSMLEDGLVEEVRSIIDMGYDTDLKPFSGIGYREVLHYLSGSIRYEDMVKDIQKKTRNYAKRQFTWFAKEKDMHWFVYPEELDRIMETLSGFVDIWN